MYFRNHPFSINLLLLILALLLSAAAGPVYIPPVTVGRILLDQVPGITLQADWTDAFATILLQIRLPHIALMALAGAALASSGAAYQGVFRNPLADPYLIGVASGAGLGAVIAMSVRWPVEWRGLYPIPLAAFCGAILTIALVYSIARVGKSLPTTTLILAGVAVSSFATSLTSFLMFRSTSELRRAIGWMLGSSVLTGWEPFLAALPYATIGMAVLVISGHALNVLQYGEEQAQQLGLAAEKAKALILVAASLTTATAVAFTGIIGFVGLIVPHLARIIWGSNYKRLLPLSILAGAWLLLLADILARIMLAPQVLPVGIVTALAGAPFFLWVLRSAKGQAFW